MFKWMRALVRRGKTPQDAAAADERPRKRPKKRDGVAARVQRNVERDGGGGGGDEAARGRHREDSDARDVDARDGGAEREDVVEDDEGAKMDSDDDEDEGDEEEGDEEEGDEEEVAQISLEEFGSKRVEEAVYARRRALEGNLRIALANASDGFHGHQIAFTTMLLERFVEGNTGTIFQADTGTGKTFTAMLIAAVFARCRVSVVFATEKMLVKEARARFHRVATDDDERYFNVVVSGSQRAHFRVLADTIDAAAAISDDVVVIVDESSRYDGVASAMNRALAASESQPFVIAMTATPVSANIGELVGIAVMVGWISQKDISALTHALAAAGEAFVASDDMRAECELTRFVDTLTCGNKALETKYPDQARELRETITARSQASRRVAIAWIADEQQREIDNALAEVETHDADAAFSFAQTVELSARLARGERRESSTSTDTVLNVLFHLLRRDLDDGSNVVVFVPSALASLAWYAAAYLNARVKKPGTRVIDQDTTYNERMSIVADFNAVDGDVTCLICTSNTAGYGIDLPYTTRAIFLTVGWVGAEFMQCCGRITRVFADNGTRLTRDITILLVASKRGSMSITRMIRTIARAKTFSSILFPSFIQMDDIDALDIKSPLSTCYFKVSDRELFETIFGDEVGDAFRDADESVKTVSLAEFVAAINTITNAHRAESRTGATWLVSRNAEHSTAPKTQRNAGARNAGARNAGARGQRAADPARESSAGLKYIRLEGKKARQHAYIATIRCVTGVGLLAMTEDEARESRAIANDVQTALARAKRATASGTTWLPSQSGPFGWLILKTVEAACPVRRFMVCASKLRPGKGFFTNPPRDNKWMAAGRENEKAAVEHVSKKYALRLIPHIDEYSRVLPTHPTLFLATPDAMSTCGVVIEVKFVHKLLNELSTNGGIHKFNEYVDQVQGQLAVFGLHYAILSLYTVDGATGDIASYEFLVRRNADWLESKLTTFEAGVTKQRQMHRNDWNDELL
jgi:superfamily II DNA or RNA helicase